MGDDDKPKELKKVQMSKMALKSRTSMMSKGNLVNRSVSRLKMRRSSYGFGSVAGLRPVERTSQVAIEFKRPMLMYLNSYQLEPVTRPHIPTLMKIIDDVLNTHFIGHKYHSVESPSLAIQSAGEIMRRVKALQFDRYRVICVVTVGQRRSQSYNNAVCFLWDHERDDYVNATRLENTCFVQVTCFSIYLD